jgi:hypothetical protein
MTGVISGKFFNYSKLELQIHCHILCMRIKLYLNVMRRIIRFDYKTCTRNCHGHIIYLHNIELQIELWPCYSTSVVVVIFVPLK